MITIKLYDSLKSITNDLDNKKINIYSCGPTVYNYIHIGNARPSLLVDTLVRYLKSRSVDVNYLQNITDIDDKIINRAIEEGLTEKEISTKYMNAYLDDLDAMNVLRPTQLTPISDKLDLMLTYIEDMVKSGDAYVVDGDVYFDIKKWESKYGQLSGRKIDELISGERVEVELKKHNPLDFTLWKKTDVGIKWDSVFGPGRPGWHTECVLLIDDYFNGETIDIHAGGIDLKFPHHENERIQFWAHNNKELALNWMHNGHLTLEDEKMSKSLGNTILAKDFIAEHGPNLLRWIFLTTYYRQPLNINESLIGQGKKFFDKISNINKKVIAHLVMNDYVITNKLDDSIIEEFNTHMDNDLNTSRVLTLLEQIVKDLNKSLTEKESIKIDQYISSMKYILDTLGFIDLINIDFTEEDREIFKQWKELLNQKDFAKADELRAILIEKKLV
ncbi:cysteine--tRNA ligase [[Acholeplasma] multilocale]|uniref:cysteine--tRNA ligase n=1 Tax=[Acholeplasma] multilocale TaxID=264638 RepID=UPI00244E2884|nr:cysteine--tRNA ligase [[Acholeplasma] multilocale]